MSIYTRLLPWRYKSRTNSPSQKSAQNPLSTPPNQTYNPQCHSQRFSIKSLSCLPWISIHAPSEEQLEVSCCNFSCQSFWKVKEIKVEIWEFPHHVASAVLHMSGLGESWLYRLQKLSSIWRLCIINISAGKIHCQAQGTVNFIFSLPKTSQHKALLSDFLQKHN